MKRSSGILMPIFSLPSNYGIGTFGKDAYDFVDFLVRAKQSYWQILPLGDTSAGDSPYCLYSTFAGNPLFIDLDELVKDKLLNINDLKGIKVKDHNYVDYDDLNNNRMSYLYKAYKNGYDENNEDYQKFIEENNYWLKDYSLFMAIKTYFNMQEWYNWPNEKLRLRDEKEINKYETLLDDQIKFNNYVQYLFFKQFDALKEYMNDKGIKLIGDIPIYVPQDSADCWANPKIFELDENNMPKEVSGVPADYFSKEGQLWGNPLYDWDYLKEIGYKWWIERIGMAAKLYDVIRLDHFRGFEAFWAVKYGAKNAIEGRWIKGPGMDLLGRIKGWYSNTEFISEDLGILTDEVRQLLKDFGFPGMKVLQFSFNANDINGSCPHTFTQNSVCYVGTHDNNTAIGFMKETDKETLKFIKEYLNISDKEEFNYALIRNGMATVSNLFVAQIQDYLGLGEETRINTPGTIGGNWMWRMSKDMLSDNLADKIASLTTLYGRDNKEIKEKENIEIEA